jgi:organic radical activating enzyme
MSNYEHDRIKEILPQIEARTSPTFCLAKWHHVTIYLHLGETHSCYHPQPHVIPLDELKENPSALHNTKQKKLERKMMLEGKKPAGCTYCWNVEAMGDDYISDRKQRTLSIHEGDKSRLDDIINNPWDMNVNPEYIELSFGNTCNFKCGYCHPRYSSRFLDEIKEHGPYSKNYTGRYDIDWFIDKLYESEEDNPYIEAWWNWWPEVSKTLNILRITGGEPTIHGSTYRLLDEINKNPMPNLELNINSNLGANPKLFDRFIEKLKPIIEEKKVKDFKLFTSIDTWDKEKAEYIRNGLDIELFKRNFDKYLTEIKDSKVSLMITFNNLCVTNFDSLLEQILVWREKYNDKTAKDRGNINQPIPLQRIQMDTPYLKEPPHYDMNILPKDDFTHHMDRHLEFMINSKDDDDNTKFKTLEVEKFRRVVDYFKSAEVDEDYLRKGRSDFYNFFNEHDRRRNTDFIKAFPEYEEFYISCRNNSTKTQRTIRLEQRRAEMLRRKQNDKVD